MPSGFEKERNARITICTAGASGSRRSAGRLAPDREQKQEQEADEENSSGDWVSCLSYSLTVTAAARVWPKEACSMSVAPTSPSGDGRRGRQRHRRVSGAARRGDGAFLHAARPHRSGLRNATARGGESERRQTCRTSRCAANARATVGADWNTAMSRSLPVAGTRIVLIIGPPTALRFSVQTSSCRPIPSGGTALPSPDLPRGTLPRSRTRSAPRNQPTASAREREIRGLMAVAVTVSQDRI